MSAVIATSGSLYVIVCGSIWCDNVIGQFNHITFDDSEFLLITTFQYSKNIYF